jgi:hypothetical protein
VSSPGSVVEYSVENKQYDFGFGITAEREEGLTIVKVRKLYYFVWLIPKHSQGLVWFFFMLSCPSHSIQCIWA